MPFPADFTNYQQFRMAQCDNELQDAMRNFIRSLERLENARSRFIALNLTALWPATGPENVHRDPQASTRDEQNDLSNFILHSLACIRNQGVTPITNAQAAAIALKYIGNG